jgi:hypothetical protein
MWPFWFFLVWVLLNCIAFASMMVECMVEMDIWMKSATYWKLYVHCA